jgi:glycosyltransferase involved in cell wall biosynthesis
MVGTIEPRKNYELLVEIYKDYKVPIPTVVIGRRGWKSHKLINQIQETNGILWISDCCDGALLLYYKRAQLFVSLSKAEGFNLPALEASRHQIDRILSDIPIHRKSHLGAKLVSLNQPSEWAFEFSRLRPKDLNILPDTRYVNRKIVKTLDIFQIFKMIERDNPDV